MRVIITPVIIKDLIETVIYIDKFSIECIFIIITGIIPVSITHSCFFDIIIYHNSFLIIFFSYS